MPASAARIGFVTREFRTAVASDAAVKTAYGEAARDTADDDGEPVETFFESVDDAASIAAERLTLLKANRRRFRHDVAELLTFTGSLDFSQATPAVTVSDTERGASHDAAVVEIALRFADDQTTLITWG